MEAFGSPSSQQALDPCQQPLKEECNRKTSPNTAITTTQISAGQGRSVLQDFTTTAKAINKSGSKVCSIV